ncbi:alpha/beta hydrolase family protein [Thermodesulfobacteriota bacterium]
MQCIASDPQPLTARSFSTLPKNKNVRISPDGKKIIYAQNVKESTVLVSHNLGAGKVTPLAVADNEKLKFRFALWANNDTVLFSIVIPDYRSGVPTMETRLMVRKADASEDMAALVKSGMLRTGNQDYFSQFQDNIISLLQDDPEHILMGIDLEKPGLDTVYKVNLNTRKMKKVQPYKEDVRDWSADQQGRIRVGTKFNPFTTSLSILIYDLDKKEWKEAWKTKVLSEVPPVTPIGFGKDPEILYVRADHNGRKAIFKVDIRKDDLPMELVVKDDKYDINGSLIHRRKTRDVVGVYHGEADGARIYWDEYMKKFQESVDKALPDTINYLVDFSKDEQRYIVFSTNDTTPGKYYLGDLDRNTLELIANDYPQLEGKLQGSKKITYIARDGKTIEGYLTLPAKHEPETPYPAVIYPHGGPMARDYQDFDYWAEFFASKGIAVLQPNFRGSSGYGREFENEALQSFGLAMQDDLTDAANWLIEHKLADPERIAIAGSSYGGYAALMGAVKTPDLFRCAISFAGISDLLMLLKSQQAYLNYGVVRKQIGTDRKKLKAVSPINHVDKIKIPILLAHGDADRIVPVEQSKKMAKQLKKKKKIYTYIELEHGDHGLGLQRNRHRFFSAMDEFLDKYLLN